MKTQTKIIYGTIVGLAVAAFAVDRWVIGDGEQPAAPAASAAPVSRIAPKPDPAAQPGKSVAARLQEAGARETSVARDAFAVPAKWMGEVTTVKAPVRDLAAEFHQRHKLNAILKGGEGGVAIIDGKALRVGQTIDGFMVATIDQRVVSLVSDGVSLEMRLARPLAATVATIR